MIKQDQFPQFDQKGRTVKYTPKIYTFSFFYEGLKQRATFFAPNLDAAKKLLKADFPTAKDIEVESH